MNRTLIHGRIPQAWDLPWLRKGHAHAERLANALNPKDAEAFRERAEVLAKAIQETEHEHA